MPPTSHVILELFLHLRAGIMCFISVSIFSVLTNVLSKPEELDLLTWLDAQGPFYLDWLNYTTRGMKDGRWLVGSILTVEPSVWSGVYCMVLQAYRPQWRSSIKPNRDSSLGDCDFIVNANVKIDERLWKCGRFISER